MKKLLVIALSAMMLFAFTACQPAGGITEENTVTTEKELREAITKGGTWYLGNSIELKDGELAITKDGFTLDGQGIYSVKRNTTELKNETKTSNSVILVDADNVILRNLTVDGMKANNSEWVDGVWGIKVYNSTGVKLSKILVKDVQIGIQVNSSEVSVDDSIIFDNTSFGGIGVDKAGGLSASTLNIAGNARFGIESTTVPAVYRETEAAGTISGLGNLSSTTYQPVDVDKTNQIWYFVEGVTVDTSVATAITANEG